MNNKHNYKIRDDLQTFILGIFESMFVEIREKTEGKNLIDGDIYRVPNTSSKNSIDMYENTIKKFRSCNRNTFIGTDQNFDYLKIDNHKNIQDLFLNNGLLPTVTKPTHIMCNSATLIDNLYYM